MKRISHCILLTVLLLSYLSVDAQHRSVPDFTNLYDPSVTCYYGDDPVNPKKHVGLKNYRHKMISTQGYDVNTDDQLPYLPEGEDKVIRLGTYTDNGCSEAITYRFNVDPTNSILLLKFAVVYQDPNHEIFEQPRFVVKVTDTLGNLIEDCAIYDVRASDDPESGFIHGIGDEDVRWRPWTSVGIDLSSYLSKEIVIEFATYDCNELNGCHFGYAYYTASCVPSKFVISKPCFNPITVTAPSFFESYQWNDGSTGQSVTYNVVEGTPLYLSCTLTSVTGCQFTLNARLAFDTTVLMQDTLVYDTICIRALYDDYYFDLPAHSEIDTGHFVMKNNLFNLNTCEDVVITLDLYVKDTLSPTHLYDERCFGEEYHDYHFDTANLAPGLHTLIHLKDTASVGCDSTTILHLYVNDVYNDTLFDTICFGIDYDKLGFYIENPQVGDTIKTLDLTSVHFCDSIVTMRLHVKPSYDRTFEEGACFGVEYEGHGFRVMPDTLGTITLIDSLTTTLGCDSIVKLNLLVTDVFHTPLKDTICLGDIYDKNGFYMTPHNVGDTLDTLYLQSVKSCDSIVYLNLYVAPLKHTDLFDTICDNLVYDTLGFHIESLIAGDTLFSLTKKTMYRCDSTVDLHLHVLPTFDVMLYDTICFGFDYDSLGFSIIAPAVGDTLVRRELTAKTTCDSVVTMNLYVAPTFTIQLYDTICVGEDYSDIDFDTISPAEGLCVMSHRFDSQYGCDSIRVMNLTVGGKPETYINDTTCLGIPYHGHGFDIDSLHSGNLRDTAVYDSYLKCDSTVYLELFVAEPYDTTFNDTVAYGEEYHNFEFNFHFIYVNPIDSTGDVTVTLTNEGLTMYNCDSTVNLNLYIASNYNVLIEDTICDGDDYHEYDFDTIAPPIGMVVMHKSLTSSLGGDSLVTLHLLVGANYDTLFVDSVCENQGYYEHGFSKDSLWAGTLYDTMYYKSILGCDSVVRLQLIVNPTFDTLFTDTICQGDSYDKHGFYYENTDEFEIGEWNNITRTDTTIFGCDSVINVNLYVAPIYSISLSDTTCFDEPYTGYGFDTVGLAVGTHTLIDSLKTNIFGCDSIVTLQLIVGSLDTVRFTDTICFGEDYVNNPDSNFVYINPEVGFHYDTARLTSRYGCDSTLTLALYVAPTYDTLFTDTICQGDSYDQHGFYYENTDEFEVGEWNDITRTDTTMLGCDSVINVTLYVAPIYDTLLFDTICHHDYYEGHGFGFYTDSLTVGLNRITRTDPTIYGCDSVINLDLYVAPTYDTLFVDSVCENQGYYEHGFSLEGLQAGWHSDSLNLQTICKCDSTVYLELYVKPVHDTLFTDTICFGESYHEHNFHLDTPEVGWNYDTQNLSTTLDCDSVVRLELYVGPVYDFVVFDSICEGEDYTEHGLNYKNMKPGDYVLMSNLFTTCQCDSIYNVNLRVDYIYDDIEKINGLTQILPSTNMITGKYTYYIDPIPGCDEYLWSFNNNEGWFIDSINENECTIYSISESTATLSVRAKNRCSDVFDSIVIVASWYDVNENAAINASVYPNPSKGLVNIECDNIKKIRLFSNTGVLLKEEDYDIINKVTLDLTGLPQSLYVLEIITIEGRCTKYITVTNN